MKRLLINSDFFKRPMLLIVLIGSIALFCDSAHAETVSADLVQKKGNALIIRMHIQSPPPASLILQFFLPSGIGILNSSPEFSKFETKSNSAKWLLRDITTGTTHISVTTSKRISINNAAAVIRYRDRNSGSMVEVRAVSK